MTELNLFWLVPLLTAVIVGVVVAASALVERHARRYWRTHGWCPICRRGARDER